MKIAKPPVAAEATRFAYSMAALGPLWPGAVGVSGGGDSIALMHLLAAWAQQHKRAAPVVLTVDHGLAPGSRQRARAVVEAATALKLEAKILTWKGDKPSADVEAAARKARYRLMGSWCRKNGIAALYIAHTEDDQAETFLLRLARGSGLDGLAAMRAHAPFPLPGFEEVSLLRPLLGMTRAELRQSLSARGVAWQEDPMNDDLRFARVRLRKLRPALEEAGLSANRIAAAAKHLSRVRELLDQDTQRLLSDITRQEGARCLIDGAALRAAPRELGLRTLAELLKRGGQQVYRPRFEQLEALYDALLDTTFSGRTLHGCRLGPAPRKLAVFGSATLVLDPEKRRLNP